MIGTFVNGKEKLIQNGDIYIAILKTGRVVRIPVTVVNRSLYFLDDNDQPIDPEYISSQDDRDEVLTDLDTWMELGF